MLGVPFVLPALWFWALFGVALFLFGLQSISSSRSAAVFGVVVFWVKSLFAVSWFLSTYPIEWMDLSLGVFELPVIIFYLSTVALFLSFGGGLLAVLWQVLKVHVPTFLVPVLFALLWVGAEILGSVGFSIGTLGAGSTINGMFSFGYLGYALGVHPLLLQGAALAGVYGLSFLGAVLGFGLYVLYQRRSRQQFVLVSISFVLILVLTGVVFKNTAPSYSQKTVAIIDTQFSGALQKRVDGPWYKQTQIEEALSAALALEPDYIILPEDSRFTDAKLTPIGAYRLFRFQSGDATSIVIDSGRVPLGDAGVLRAVVYDGNQKTAHITDKQYLVPQGEFMPTFYARTLQLIGMGDTATALGKKLSYRPGPQNTQSEFPDHVPGILFCFESADPRGVRKLLAEREVPFVAHPISHAWFHQSQILWQQQDVMLKIQALWNQVSIVSAGNMMQGALYTKTGEKVIPTPVASGESWRVSVVRLQE
jgi:apolipoprotein N-acyltransferase